SPAYASSTFAMSRLARHSMWCQRYPVPYGPSSRTPMRGTSLSIALRHTLHLLRPERARSIEYGASCSGVGDSSVSLMVVGGSLAGLGGFLRARGGLRGRSGGLRRREVVVELARDARALLLHRGEELLHQLVAPREQSI